VARRNKADSLVVGVVLADQRKRPADDMGRSSAAARVLIREAPQASLALVELLAAGARLAYTAAHRLVLSAEGTGKRSRDIRLLTLNRVLFLFAHKNY